MSFILSEVAAAGFAGAFGALIYSKYITLSELYQLGPQSIDTNNNNDNSYLKFHYHNIKATKSVDSFFYLLPFVCFFLLFGTNQIINIGRSEIISAMLIGLWVALGFNSMFLQGMFRHKLQQSLSKN